MMIGERARTLVVVHHQWCRPIVRPDTKQSAYKVAAAFAAAKAKPRRTSGWREGVAGGLRVPRWVEMGLREGERENHSGIREWVLSTELIKTSPFNGLLSLSISLSLSFSRNFTHTHVQVYIHTHVWYVGESGELESCWWPFLGK